MKGLVGSFKKHVDCLHVNHFAQMVEGMGSDDRDDRDKDRNDKDKDEADFYMKVAVGCGAVDKKLAGLTLKAGVFADRGCEKPITGDDLKLIAAGLEAGNTNKRIAFTGSDGKSMGGVIKVAGITPLSAERMCKLEQVAVGVKQLNKQLNRCLPADMVGRMIDDITGHKREDDKDDRDKDDRDKKDGPKGGSGDEDIYVSGQAECGCDDRKGSKTYGMCGLGGGYMFFADKECKDQITGDEFQDMVETMVKEGQMPRNVKVTGIEKGDNGKPYMTAGIVIPGITMKNHEQACKSKEVAMVIRKYNGEINGCIKGEHLTTMIERMGEAPEDGRDNKDDRDKPRRGDDGKGDHGKGDHKPNEEGGGKGSGGKGKGGGKGGSGGAKMEKSSSAGFALVAAGLLSVLAMF